MSPVSKKAVCLLSGGLDSTTALAIAQSQGFDVHALSFHYGQRHSIELEKAKLFAKARGVANHIVIQIDLRSFGGSALTADLDVPKHDSLSDSDGGIPITYVPARNTIFLSFALGWAEVIGAQHIFIGVNSLDYSGYPDCRPEYIAAFEQLANLATKAGVEGAHRLAIHAPLATMSKADIIRAGMEHGVDFAETSSCYDPSAEGKPCGHCDSCLLRAKGFAEAGTTDPLYAKFGMLP